MRILVAVSEEKGMNTVLSEHFGHCKNFAIYETDNSKLEFVKNTIDHSDVKLSPVEQIMTFKPDVVISLGMGMRAINLFAKQNVSVKTGKYSTLKEVIDNIDSLDDFSDGCQH